MPANFATVVEQVQNLSSLEKMDLRKLLDKYLIEERREEIYQNDLISRQQHHENSLEFSSDLNWLKEISKNTENF